MAAPSKDKNVQDEQQPTVPQRLVFRIPRPSLLAVLGVMLFASPFATALAWLWLVYLLPLAVGYWILRVRTVADGTGLVARNLTRTDRMTWDEVRSLRLSERHWTRAVRTDGREVLLPSVRLRHLPALSLVSGGRITDPTEVPRPDADAAAAEAPENEAATETATGEAASGETPTGTTPANETPTAESRAGEAPTGTTPADETADTPAKPAAETPETGD